MTIIERVRAAIESQAETRQGLARKAGLHRNSLNGCERDDWNPSWKTLQAVEPHLPIIERERANA